MMKSFIYLDEYKMYSLSSQIFEGVTEYSIRTNREAKEEREEQKGPLGSGKTLADVLTGSKETTEKRYLHDYSYVQFEKYLFEKNQIFVVNEDTNESIEAKIPCHSFIRVTGKAVFNDIVSIVKTLESLNQLGEALTYVTHYQLLTDAKMQLEQQASNLKDRNQKTKLEKEIKNFDETIKRLAIESGVYHSPDFINKLSYLLSYGFQDQLQLQIALSNTIFSSDLNRVYLREKEASLIRKFSRRTEKTFTIFGIVTQFKGSDTPEKDVDESGDIPSTPKELIMKLASNLTNVENSFTGKLPNEVVIDPIAIYTEL